MVDGRGGSGGPFVARVGDAVTDKQPQLPAHIQQFEDDVCAAFPRLTINYFEAHADGFLRCSLGVDGGGDITPTIFVDVCKMTNGTYKVDRCKGATVIEARNNALQSYRMSRARLSLICAAIQPDATAKKVTP